MLMLSALLVFGKENPSVISAFHSPYKEPVIKSFDGFCVISLIKLFYKQETVCGLRHHNTHVISL